MFRDSDLLKSFLFPTKILFREMFRKYAPLYVQGRVLDIGAGKQPYKNFLPKTVNQYITVDIDEKVKPDIVSGADKVPVESESFDTILCNEVIEHIYEPQEVLNEMYRVLKPSGYVYITVPMEWCLHYEPYDYWRYTPYSLRKLLDDSGFETVVLERVGGLFTVVGQRVSDVLFFKFLFLYKLFPEKVRTSLATVSVLPLNILTYISGKLLDWIDKRDAFAWLVIARKS